MISVAQAKHLIDQNTSFTQTIVVDLYQANGYAIANNILSPIDFPSFRQSAMDGYAIRFEDWNQINTFFVEQEIQAGNNAENINLNKGEAIRIFTGAHIPDDADTVVMQEHCTRIENQIQITNPDLKQGNNIRDIGSQTKKGELVLTKGSTIHAGTAGLLAGLGIHQIEVFQKPSCIILTTGKELKKPGDELINGQIYESNSYALYHGLTQLQINQIEIVSVDDDLDSITKAIHQALHQADILLITGGVSVGDYDFVAEALENNQVEKIFHRVKQKPGKPLYFGKKNNKIIFGLPGNPGSVLTCFYQYVIPCIHKMMGHRSTENRSIQLPLLNPLNKKKGLTHFIKGKFNTDGVEVLDHQESYKLTAFAEANCLIQIDEEIEHVNIGEFVKVHLL
ncbi:MAG TPA: molybdopterin molybdotransferase MoeA [Chitinophagaceae bacterium]|nr:molybdopterin molybdotransferase MoeA [Chitinophagaceae bacterium]